MVLTTRTVIIPARAEHEGIYSRKVILNWVCPVCGIVRGEPFSTVSYDGSRRLFVHGWTNPCGHIDYYDAVRKEADNVPPLAYDAPTQPELSAFDSDTEELDELLDLHLYIEQDAHEKRWDERLEHTQSKP